MEAAEQKAQRAVELCRCGHPYTEHLEYKTADRQHGCTVAIGEDSADHVEWCQCAEFRVAA